MTEKTMKIVHQHTSVGFNVSASERRMLEELEAARSSQLFRFTPLRQLVYLFVYRGKNKGIGAYQILNMMKSYNPQAKPATVYRSLDFLLQTRLIIKIESKSKFIVRNECNNEEMNIYMVCSNCGSVNEYADNAFKDTLNKLANKSGCLIENDYIEISVICPKCQHSLDISR